MKDVYITGPYCAGKTWAAQRLAADLGVSSLETDSVYVPLLKKYEAPINYTEHLTPEIREEIIQGLRKLLAGQGPNLVINGFALNYRWVRDVIQDIRAQESLLFNIVPDPNRWQHLYDLRTAEDPIMTPATGRTWENYIEFIRRFEAPDTFYYTLGDAQQLLCSRQPYQQLESASRKFAGLPLAGVTGRVLDVGCAEGLMGGFLLARGAQEVVGLDTNWWLLEQARTQGNRVVLGDLNAYRLTDLGLFDHTLCLSILHRVMNKEHCIQQIAAVTRKTAVFELPICLDTGLVQRRYDDVEGHTKTETQAWPPSRAILESWFSRYFKSWEYVGLSPLKYGDESRRVVYVCRTHI